MKKIIGIILVVSFILGACGGNKPYYKTSKGKKKLKYYNGLQYGGTKAKGY